MHCIQQFIVYKESLVIVFVFSNCFITNKIKFFWKQIQVLILQKNIWKIKLILTRITIPNALEWDQSFFLFSMRSNRKTGLRVNLINYTHQYKTTNNLNIFWSNDLNSIWVKVLSQSQCCWVEKCIWIEILLRIEKIIFIIEPTTNQYY